MHQLLVFNNLLSVFDLDYKFRNNPITFLTINKWKVVKWCSLEFLIDCIRCSSSTDQKGLNFKNMWWKNSSGWNSAFKILCINNSEIFGKENGMLAWITKTYTANHGKISKVYFTRCLHMDMQYFLRDSFMKFPTLEEMCVFISDK